MPIQGDVGRHRPTQTLQHVPFVFIGGLMPFKTPDGRGQNAPSLGFSKVREENGGRVLKKSITPNHLVLQA